MIDFHDEAARWHARTMNGPLSAADERALDAWLDADLRHRAAYTDIVAAGLALKHLRPRVAVPARPARRWPAWVAGAAAAPLALALIAAVPHVWQDWRSDVHTATGALADRRLDDGSRLQLDTDSAARVATSAGSRDVELLRGALAVEVAKDPGRPFHVRAGGVVVTAVGTKFVVALGKDGSVDVGLVEGKVTVASGAAAPVALEAGERLRFDANAVATRDAIPATAYSWSRGVIAFDRAPLADALVELDRYLPERVVLSAKSHAGAVVPATFPAHDPRAALESLARSEGLRVDCVRRAVCVVRE